LFSILFLTLVYSLVVAEETIEFQSSNVPVTIIIIPVPPAAIPEGISVTMAIMYGKQATRPKNGAPIQFILFNTF
jgi:hypothetical protein